MDDQPTCGKGLAAAAALPAKFAELATAMAKVLEHHRTALDLHDESAAREHEAYGRVVEDHRRIAADLEQAARRMVGYRDLPMGPHDMQIMTSTIAVQLFDDFVRLEGELVELVRSRLEQDQQMLKEMA